MLGTRWLAIAVGLFVAVAAFAPSVEAVHEPEPPEPGEPVCVADDDPAVCRYGAASAEDEARAHGRCAVHVGSFSYEVAACPPGTAISGEATASSETGCSGVELDTGNFFLGLVLPVPIHVFTFACTAGPAASGEGPAHGAVAVSGSGPARGTETCLEPGAYETGIPICRDGVATSPLGSAQGFAAVSGTDPASGGIAASGTDDAEGENAALTGTGTAHGLVAASGTGPAEGGFAGASVVGDAHGLGAATVQGEADGGIALTVLGNATGDLVAVSATGDSSGYVAVSVLGEAERQVAASGCDLGPCSAPVP
jgi:hypothetical protein